MKISIGTKLILLMFAIAAFITIVLSISFVQSFSKIIEKEIPDKPDIVSEAEHAIAIKTIFFGFILLAIFLPIVLFLSMSISNPIKKLKEGADIIGKGNLDYRLDIKTRDEIQDLSESFNKMAVDLKKTSTELKKYSVNLEKEVNKKTMGLQDKVSELQKFTKLTIGRELRMIGLKKKIKELEGKKE